MGVGCFGQEHCADEQLLEPSPQADYTDFLHDLVVRAEYEASSGDSQEITQENLDSAKGKNEAAKEKRGPGRPTSKKSAKERRQGANARERKRMRALVR